MPLDTGQVFASGLDAGQKRRLASAKPRLKRNKFASDKFVKNSLKYY